MAGNNIAYGQFGAKPPDYSTLTLGKKPANNIPFNGSTSLNAPGLPGYRPSSGLTTGSNNPGGGIWDTSVGQGLIKGMLPADHPQVKKQTVNVDPATGKQTHTQDYFDPNANNPNKPEVKSSTASAPPVPQIGDPNQNTSGGPIGQSEPTDWSKNPSTQNLNGYTHGQPLDMSLDRLSGNNIPTQNFAGNNPGMLPNSPYVDQLGNQGGSNWNTAARNYTAALGTQTGQNQTYADRAKAIADSAGADITRIGTQGASSEAGQRTTGTSPVAEGNAAITAQTTGLLQSARAAGANMQLSGNAQGLTAQGQAQSGYNQAAGQALTGQSLGQNALSSAAGYALPNSQQFTTTPGQTVYNAHAQPIAGGMNPNVISSIINGIKGNNGMTYDGAVAALGAYANDPNAVSALRDSLQREIPGYNIPASAGQASATQSNIQTGGTAAVNAGNAAYQQANQDFLKLQNEVIPNIDQFGELLTSGAGGINPFDAKFGNKTIAEFKSQLSNPQQAAFDSTFQSLQAKIADLLNIGGSQIPTDVSSGAKSILDPSAKLSTIKSTLDRIAKEGHIVLTNKGKLSNEALKQAQSGTGESVGSWPGWNPQ